MNICLWGFSSSMNLTGNALFNIFINIMTNCYAITPFGKKKPIKTLRQNVQRKLGPPWCPPILLFLYDRTGILSYDIVSTTSCCIHKTCYTPSIYCSRCNLIVSYIGSTFRKLLLSSMAMGVKSCSLVGVGRNIVSFYLLSNERTNKQTTTATKTKVIDNPS